MEKNNLKKIEKELNEIKTYTMVQSHIQKELLLEIKQLKRDINGNFKRNRPRKHSNRKSK